MALPKGLEPTLFVGGAYRNFGQADAAHERGAFKPVTNGRTLAALASKLG